MHGRVRHERDRHPDPHHPLRQTTRLRGKPLPIYEINLVDDEDNEVPPGVPGEIIFRPKEPFTMMLGYYNMPDKTLETYQNLWFHTGDLAKKDEDGYFYFEDRKKDSPQKTGENISSFEV